MNKILKTIQLLTSVLRLREIFLMTGFVLIGFFCAISPESLFSTRTFIILSIAVFMHFSSIYFFNSYTGFSEDQKNSRIKHGIRAGITTKNFLSLSVISFIISLFLYWIINKFLPLMAVASYMGWVVYSWKNVGLKQTPFAGTVFHFFSQLLHFSMGWITVSAFDFNTMIEAIYFAFLFSGGHLNHELIDYEVDKKTNVKTGAVTLGKEKTEFVYRIISFFTLIYLSLIIFYNESLIHFFAFLPASALQTALAFSLKEEPLKRQKLYRSTFLFSGFIFIFLTL